MAEPFRLIGGDIAVAANHVDVSRRKRNLERRLNKAQNITETSSHFKCNKSWHHAASSDNERVANNARGSSDGIRKITGIVALSAANLSAAATWLET